MTRSAIIRIDADPEEPERVRPPAVALIGDAKPILKRAARRASGAQPQAHVA